jgi:hypothetical protein
LAKIGPARLARDQKGPPPLPEGENEMVRVWYAKMLVRIARGDLESKYRRVEIDGALFQAGYRLRIHGP